MRKGILWAIPLLGVVGLGFTREPSRALVEVAVTANCAQTDASSVSPNPVRVIQGDDIDWLLSGAGADSVLITPKTPAWPFPVQRHSSVQNPGRGRGGAPNAVAQARAMLANQRGRTFGYNVTIYCGNVSHLIDPDIIIDE